MKTGKIPENVWKRSILRQIKNKRDEVVVGAGIGDDCAIFSFSEQSQTVTASGTAPYSGKGSVRYAMNAALNKLAASGAEPVALTLTFLLPAHTEEITLKEMMAEAEAECTALSVQIADGKAEVSTGVTQPITIASGIGMLRKEEAERLGKLRPGQDIVISKWIGQGGTALIAEAGEKELLARYPFYFINEAKQMGGNLSVISEAATAIKSGVCAMHSVAEGGIFGALWEMAEGAGVGLEIDLKKLPVRQETIEICEFFLLSPYELDSLGCLLMAADNGFDLVRALERHGIPAAVVGKATDNHDRIVWNEDEKRFLDRPKTDELYKFLER